MQTIFHRVLNSNRMIERRRELRQKPTAAEEMLWQYLRNSGLGVRFKRQYSVMNYVVDFYCPKIKLVIELDGSIHETSKKYDLYRTEYLNSLGIKEIRFRNERIENEINLVLEEIKSNLPSPEVLTGSWLRRRRGTEGEV